MKALIKYIALLIFSGVIIPLYQPTCAVKPAQLNSSTAVANNADPVSNNHAFHFYFVHDVVAKLLPVADLFK